MAGGITYDPYGGSSDDRWLRSPRQASQIFGLGGAHAPRNRNLFVVNFKKSGDTSQTSSTLGTTSTTNGSATGTWTKQLGFLVKSVDRPSMEPKTEELNQYNKKRIVHTGYKIGQTRLVLYDTADSMAMQMWNEYANYYFGDFRHYGSRTDFALDTVSPTFNGASNGGFGFAPRSSTASALTTTTDLQVPYFFDSVSIYQVYGGNFVQFDLINPKITNFDPDEQDYGTAEISTITMTMSAEAILYVNNFQAQPISADAFLSEAFGNIAEFDGDVVDYANGTDAASPYTYGYNTGSPAPLQPYSYGTTTYDSALGAPVPLRAYDYGTGTGSLTAYGNYNFGSTTSGVADTRALSQDLSLQATTNPALASVLTVAAQTQASTLAAATQQIVKPYTQPTYLSQDDYDAARNAVAAVGQSIGNIDTSTAIGQQVVYGIMSAAIAQGTNPRDQMYNQKPLGEDITNSWSSQSSQGLSLTSETYGVMNAQRSPTAQVGFNTANANKRVASGPPNQFPVTPPRPAQTIDPAATNGAVDLSNLTLSGSSVLVSGISTLSTGKNSLYSTVVTPETIVKLP